MNAYSKDLRMRVLAAVDRGTAYGEVSRLFGVSLATIGRYVKRKRETREVAPRLSPGRTARICKNAEERRALWGQLEECPEATLEQHRELWGGARWREGFGCDDEPGDSPLGVDLQAKTVAASERDEEARAAWRERVALLDPRRLVFVDECDTNTGLAPLRARAPKGERAYGKAPRNRGKNTTLLASMGAGGMGPSLAVEGATTKAVFETYVERVLAPSLSPGQVMVMDNLSAHKGERVREILEARGCEVLFLPSYSLDFSPIEEAFSKLKALLRRARARTKEAVVGAIEQALDAITPGDAKGWFAHCGYASTQSL